MKPLSVAIQRFLHNSPYHPCLLLVALQIERLHEAEEELAGAYDWPRLPIGPELSGTLLSYASRDRSRQAIRWLNVRLRDYRPGPLLCTEVDLLFDPSLTLDPLALLRAASRSTCLVALWPGTLEHDTLAYAVPEHDHYRTWQHPQLSIEVLD